MKLMKSTGIIWSILFIGVFIHNTESRKRAGKNHRSPCPRGCARCDDVNGCTQCRRSFLFISKSKGKEFGECVHRCPEGYFGDRGKPTNRCLKCKVPNCKSCFSAAYCTKCQENFFLNAATCTSDCPAGFTANPYTGKCEDKVDCVVGKWSRWSKCTQKGRSRSCKHGRKRRTREILQRPTENGKKCPRLKDTRKCRMPENECFSINKVSRRQRLDDKRRKRNRKGGKRKHKRRVQSNSAKREITDVIFSNKPGR